MRAAPRFVKAPETLLYPDENGAYTISAEIEGLPANEEISLYAGENEIDSQTSSEAGTVTFNAAKLSNITDASVVVTFKNAANETIDGLKATIQLAPAVPAITSGTEIEHKAGEALTITWGEVTGATDYIVKIDGKEHSTIKGTDITIPGSYFEDGKSYAITIEARKGSGETAVVGKPATVNVAVGTQPLAEGTFTVEEALLDSNGTATVRISASNLDPRVVSIRMTHGATTQLFTDLSQPMELTIPNGDFQSDFPRGGAEHGGPLCGARDFPGCGPRHREFPPPLHPVHGRGFHERGGREVRTRHL